MTEGDIQELIGEIRLFAPSHARLHPTVRLRVTDSDSGTITASIRLALGRNIETEATGS